MPFDLVNEDKKETALLIAVDTGDYDADVSRQELCELADTAGAEVVAQMTQKRDTIEGATYVGKGRLSEIAEFCENNDVDVIIADGELSPVQVRNIEDATDTRVVDRTTLILDIFAGRAQSKEGKLQVELAQLKYSLPRLTGKGTSLSRLGGGIGTRGPGETKLETDRRHIRRRIQYIKNELDDVERRRNMQHQRRKKNGVQVAAIVGYTNAGMSTLMNKLTDAGVLQEDKLFA
ncbi:MAG: GTPase HflX, partial [Eubacterium sp.]|nr:GTPase HflX [Eubacterium sp.]